MTTPEDYHRTDSRAGRAVNAVRRARRAHTTEILTPPEVQDVLEEARALRGMMECEPPYAPRLAEWAVIELAEELDKPWRNGGASSRP